MRLWLCACVAVISGFGSQVMAASPFDGTWSAHVVRRSADQDLTLVLTSDDAGRVTGSLVGQADSELAIAWGFVKDDVIVFKVDVPMSNNRVLPFVYVGRIEGEEVAFGRRPEDLSVGYLIEFTAQRAK